MLLLSLSLKQKVSYPMHIYQKLPFHFSLLQRLCNPPENIVQSSRQGIFAIHTLAQDTPLLHESCSPVMSSDCVIDKIFILDAVAHGLNISTFELMTILTPQAPLSNLLLVPALKVQNIPTSTLIPVPSPRFHQKVPVLPTADEIPTAAMYDEPENDLYLEFLIMYWMCLAFVISVAVLAIMTKLTMSVRKNLAERKPDQSKPLTDVDRWCMRRKMQRESEAKRQEDMRGQMEQRRECQSLATRALE